MWREIGEAPTAVSNIDWSYWASKVEDKKAFEEIKAKHEAKSFAPVKAAVYQTPEQFEAALVNAKKEAAMYTSLIADLEAEAEKTLQVCRLFCRHLFCYTRFYIMFPLYPF